LAAKVRYIGISCTADYLEIFQAGYFFIKKQIAMVFNERSNAVVFNENPIITSFYLA